MNSNAIKTTIAHLPATPLTLNQNADVAVSGTHELEMLSATEIQYVGGGTAVVNIG